MDTKNCPKCESKHWMTGVKMTLPKLTLYISPETWLEGPKGLSAITVSVCGDCGFIEFYAADPSTMWEEWRKHNA